VNLKNRIKKLERETNSDSEFCECQPIKTEWHKEKIHYDAYSTGEYVAYQHSEQCAANERRAESTKANELCDDCHKPIQKQIIILQMISSPIGQDNFHDRKIK